MPKSNPKVRRVKALSYSEKLEKLEELVDIRLRLKLDLALIEDLIKHYSLPKPPKKTE